MDTAHELLCNRNSAIDAISLNGTPVPLGEAPDGALADFKIAASGQQLWRILNAATDAFLDLSIVDAEGEALPFQVIARDGSPLADDAGAALPLPHAAIATRAPRGSTRNPAGRAEEGEQGVSGHSRRRHGLRGRSRA